MLRLLAVPVAVAVAAVLASSACASAGDGSETAPAIPDASTTQSSQASPGVTELGAAEPSAAEPGATPPSASDQGAAGDASAAPSGPPEALRSTDAMQGDPGEPGLPEQSGASIDDVLRLGAVASWVDQPRLIALSLPASSSCWAFASEPVVESPTRIVVHVEQSEPPCDPLDAARTYAIAVPEGIDASADLQLAVEGLEYEFTLTLPAE